ncbi:DUF362 domain-containing protein [Candidatus Bathyarchaeota archaeon]|nr:DUF362 domain-containing protein [Candidatus Bathyarchaeota archaeon]
MRQIKVKITEIQGNIPRALKQSLEDFPLRKKRRIFLKPNICTPEYSPGAVTTPALLAELVCLLRDQAEEVMVGESDIYNCPCKRAFKETGIETAVKKAGGKIVNLSEDSVVRVKIRNSKLKELFLPKTLLDADCVIDVPVMKTHEYKIYSGALKNMFGCIPDSRRIFLHPHLDEVLFQLYKILKPELTIMDAIVAMEGTGPTKGKPVEMGLVLTSNDALALDLTATELMGINWKTIDYLNYIAQKAEIGNEQIEVTGCKVSDFKREFELPRVDLAVAAQKQVFQRPLLTKVFFGSKDVVKLLKGATIAYRKLRREQS